MTLRQLLKLGLLGYGIFNAIKASANVTNSKYVKGNISLPDNVIKTPITYWSIPPEGLRFSNYFIDAEKKYSLPSGILSRMAYQESRFRDDIITGKKKSSAGAIGLMQIIPKFHPNVNPYDPIDSIYYAGEYLRKLYNRFGTWEESLAAYNWGPTNLDKYGLAKAPKETQDYINNITNDIGIA